MKYAYIMCVSEHLLSHKQVICMRCVFKQLASSIPIYLIFYYFYTYICHLLIIRFCCSRI